MRFEGFQAEGLRFLADLAREQSRDWFTANRAVYDRALQGPLVDLVIDLTDELARRGVALKGDPKRSIFRIHRDVRFSKDKSPYKTNISAALTPDGGKMAFGVLYLQIGAAGGFAACGFYQPDPSDLDALRQAVVNDPGAWGDVAGAMARNGLTLAADDAALKRVPRGFEGVDDPALQNLLKRRSWIVQMPLSTTLVGTPGLVGAIADFAAGAQPLLHFGLTAAGRA